MDSLENFLISGIKAKAVRQIGSLHDLWLWRLYDDWRYTNQIDDVQNTLSSKLNARQCEHKWQLLLGHIKSLKT